MHTLLHTTGYTLHRHKKKTRLQNCLSLRQHTTANRQLVDFGLGVKFTDEDERFREDVGSLYYVAPEVLRRNYTKVVLYVRLRSAVPVQLPRS